MEKSSYIASKIDKNNLADTNATFTKITKVMSDGLKLDGGSTTAAALNSLVDPMPNLVIKITTGGTLTLGAVAVITADNVFFNGLIWVKLLSKLY